MGKCYFLYFYICFSFIFNAVNYSAANRCSNEYDFSDRESLNYSNSTNEKNANDFKESFKTKPWHNYRLPLHIIPMNYNLLFHVDISEDTYQGTVDITVLVKESTDYFILHAKDLNVTQKPNVLELSSGMDIDLKEVFLYSKYDYLVLKTRNNIFPGKYVLKVIFEGKYLESIGMYKTAYLDAARKKRYLATTFFAPNYARRAFPCFDEPSFKATYTVSVLHGDQYFALSNAFVKNTEIKKDNFILTTFEETPPMSTYLLCITVCDFEYKESVTENGVRIRAYTTSTNIEKTNFALSWANGILTYFERYLDVPYPLKKLDLLSLPEFFATGMENWGLVVFDDHRFLVDETYTTTNKLDVALLISHELSHMWFGNLVTMDWWNETWLNEGFATYFAWKGGQQVLPEYSQIDDSGLFELYSIMKFDQHRYSYPIIRPVTDVTFAGVYNSIIYVKGASVLRMLEYIMGEEEFISRISVYLKRHAYGTVTTNDLIDALTLTSEKEFNVSDFLKSWLNLRNFPFISVQQSNRIPYKCFVQQRRFLVSPKKAPTPSNDCYSNETWYTVASYKTSGSNEVNELLVDSADKMRIPCLQSEWFKFNVDFRGYYLINYNSRNWRQLIKALKLDHTVFSPRDRVNLLIDAYMLASKGVINYSIPLSMSNYLKNEDFHRSWFVALDYLRDIKRYYLHDTGFSWLIEKYIRNLSRTHYRRLGWEDEGDFLEKQLRRQIIEAACGNSNQHCLQTAVELFQNWMNGENLEAEIAEQVFKFGLATLNDENSFNYMWNKYLEEENTLLKEKYKDSLSSVRNPVLLRRLLNYTLNGNYFTSSEQIKMLQSIAANDVGFPMISNLIFTEWKNLVKMFDSQAEAISEQVFSQYQTEKDLEKVKKFYNDNPSTTANAESRMRTIENILLNIDWLKKHQNEVAFWFRRNVRINRN